MIFERGIVPGDFREKLIKLLYKKCEKSEFNNYRGISLVSVRSKLLILIVLTRLRDDVDQVLREEQFGFGKGNAAQI